MKITIKNNPTRINEAVNAILYNISVIPDELKRFLWLKELSRRYDIPIKILEKKLNILLDNKEID